ncbi:MAG TPA: SHOCT domain-containing protein [Candidatus Limnocylindrales bacterium]
MKPSGVSIGTVLGYLAGIVVGTMSITLLYLGMRAVMDVGGACADGGPFVTAQPCPAGTPLAMVGGMFGLFGAAGLIMWFGSRISTAATAVVALGWPILFVSLGANFLDYGLHPTDGENGPVWGWLIPGILFWVMGLAPVVVAIAAWREARAGRPGNRMSQQVVNRLLPAAGSASATGGVRPAMPTDVDARQSDQAGFASSAFAPVYAAAGRSSGVTPAFGPAVDLAEDLERLSRLHAIGELNDEEFGRAKADVLTRADVNAAAERRR